MADQFAQDRNMVPDSRAEFEALENAQEAMKQAHQHLLFADACGGVTVFDSHAIQETCEALHDAIEGLKPIQVATQRQQERIAALEAQVQALSLDAFAKDASIGHLSRLVDAERTDAARYQWLRGRDLETISHGGVFAGKTPDNVILNGEDLDRAIDDAITASKGNAA